MALQLVPVSIESILVGQALPFALRDENGILLAQKGFVVSSRTELDAMVGRGSGLFIDVSDSESHHRAYVNRLYNLVGQNRSLGQIADTKISSTDNQLNRLELGDTPPDWLDLQSQVNTLLRDPAHPQFQDRLQRLLLTLRHHCDVNPDGCLFALFHLSSSEIRMYSATHAMLVTVMCSLAAREVLNWPAEIDYSLSRAALTMNIGMTELQDQLAAQVPPPTPAQRRDIDQHAELSAVLLEKAGIRDADLLQAVREHHRVGPGPLAGKSPGQRMARLIQRADMFSARLSPRATRVPVAPAAAMQASYFDENRQVDEAGAALIKAVGIYSPGSFVRLSTQEIAVVIRRGINTTMPRVAVLVNREGLPTAEPIVRDTSLREYRITGSVAHRDVKIQLNLQRLLPLTQG